MSSLCQTRIPLGVVHGVLEQESAAKTDADVCEYEVEPEDVEVVSQTLAADDLVSNEHWVDEAVLGAVNVRRPVGVDDGGPAHQRGVVKDGVRSLAVLPTKYSSGFGSRSTPATSNCSTAKGSRQRLG